MTLPVPAGSTVIPVADTEDFTVGMEIVIGLGTALEEFNSIVSFGTIHTATPLQHSHPAGTTVSQKKADATTTIAPAGPCGPTTTTTVFIYPCHPEVITTTRGPCDPVVKKYGAMQGALAAGNGASLSMIIGWSFAGFVAVAVAMMAIRRQYDTRTGSLSRTMRAEGAELEYGMLETQDEEAPLE